MGTLEIVKPLAENVDIKVILFDFDGTISTLRQGWEQIMEPLMIEMISGPRQTHSELEQEVKDYINESTGIQTIYQMQWLAEKVEEYGWNPEVLGPWDYKEEYNKRLLKMVNYRIKKLEDGESSPEEFMIKGSYQFLQKLQSENYKLYLASGTDHPDVVHETEILGVKDFFEEIAGAPVKRADSSKAKVISHLLDEKGLTGSQLLIIGDGKVEISMGIDRDAVTLGAAVDEIKREGLNSWKRKRLIKAGAHAITGDFKNYGEIIRWFNKNKKRRR